MAEADAQSEPERCRALTAEGERCSRPAQADGFCYQHDESDPTVSESDTAAQEAAEPEGEPDDDQRADAEGETEADAETETEVDPSEVDTTDPTDVDTSDLEVDVDDERVEGLLAVRQTVERTAGQLIGRQFDGVSEITPTEDGWRAVVEVVERSSIPDTMDVLGRYEVDLDENGVIEGYRRIDRYRRGDTVEYESG